MFTDCRPEMHQLDLLTHGEKTVRVIQIVAPVWESFALRLHFSQDAITLIERDHHQQASRACHTMFRRWLDGEGREPVSWRTLITALKEAQLTERARDLENIIRKK